MPIKKIKKKLLDYYNHRFKFTLLLIFIVAYLFAIPLLPKYGFWIDILDIFSSFMLFAAVGAVGTVSFKHRTFRLSILLGTIALISVWYVRFFNADFRSSMIAVVGLSSQTIFLWMVVILVLKNILEFKEITLDIIAGAVAAYLLLGIAFAYSYSIALLYDPSALLSGGLPLNSESYLIDLAYFSFVTLTTLGFGDITPGIPITKTLVYFEAAAGVLYTATVIASFVGIHISQNSSNTPGK